MELMFLWLGINALIGYALGKPKNEVGASILVCICLGPIGWLLCILNKGKVRKCPYCAEDVKPEAVVCRHCGRDLPQFPSKEPMPRQISLKRRKQEAIALVLVGLVVLGGMLLYAAMHKDPIPATNTSLSQPREDIPRSQRKLETAMPFEQPAVTNQYGTKVLVVEADTSMKPRTTTTPQISRH